MNKKFLFFTSAVIMCMACPAMAESFPSDGNMVENETYANAAVYDNTGVYEGTATANAYYSTNEYTVSAGSYFTGLDANNDATTATCTSGNYCPGVTNTTYDDVNSAFVDDGLQTCPSGYASSDLGASANTQCYRTCDIANMGENGTIAAIAHAASLSGHDYYGNGTDTCEPATCVSGWHVKAGSNDLKSFIGDTNSVGTGYKSNNGSGYNFKTETYDIINNGEFVIDYGTKGKIRGNSRCSSQQGSDFSEITTRVSLSDETGKYCYCNVTEYTPVGGSVQSLSSSWVFSRNFDGSGALGDCEGYCAYECQSKLESGSVGFIKFRETLLSSAEGFYSTASCEANTINITWNDASAEDIAATGAATTVYEGDIKTPLKAITKPGKTFVGWKFIKPTNPAPVQGEGD